MKNDTTDLCATIGAVMGQVLTRRPLAADEDFFDCGGDSVGAVDVLLRLSHEPMIRPDAAEELQARLLETIFEDATPGRLADVCQAFVSARSERSEPRSVNNQDYVSARSERSEPRSVNNQDYVSARSERSEPRSVNNDGSVDLSGAATAQNRPEN
jgi:hypothetical protein